MMSEEDMVVVGREMEVKVVALHHETRVPSLSA